MKNYQDKLTSKTIFEKIHLIDKQSYLRLYYLFIAPKQFGVIIKIKDHLFSSFSV